MNWNTHSIFISRLGRLWRGTIQFCPILALLCFRFRLRRRGMQEAALYLTILALGVFAHIRKHGSYWVLTRHTALTQFPGLVKPRDSFGATHILNV